LLMNVFMNEHAAIRNVSSPRFVLFSIIIATLCVSAYW
jgi:hypothetical protein